MAKAKVLYFSGPHCVHCRSYGPVVADVAGELGLEVDEVDVAGHPDVAAHYEIRTVPTVLLTYGDHVMMQTAGPKKRSYLRKRLSEMLEGGKTRAVRKKKKRKAKRRGA